jgi:ADP-dependent NAD(P)H-hydrate dehydratase / NAD(P)H-hydrate epimerase
MKLVSVTEMKKIEKEADSHGLSYSQMMENAGHGLAQLVLNRFNSFVNSSVIGLVGPGNNGGDTLVALSEIASAGWQARAFLARPRSLDDPLVLRFLEHGGELLSVGDDPQFSLLGEWLQNASVVIDGILGTGFQMPLKPELAATLNFVKKYRERIYVVAVDCPSGVDCETGEAAEECISADITICMAAVKLGLIKFPAFGLVGEIIIADIGLPDDLKSWAKVREEVINQEWVRAVLPERKADSHKGSFGTAMIAAGSINYTGAALLAARGAYRVGSGLVRVAVPGPLHSILAGKLPEATWLLLPHEMGVISEDAAEVLLMNIEKTNALLLGPGWGMEETTGAFLNKILAAQAGKGGRSNIGFVVSEEPTPDKPHIKLPPLIIDADGLRLLALIPKWFDLLPEQTILTPHPGEMAALTGKSISEIQDNRLDVAREFAKKWKQVIILKGAITVIAAPDGRLAVIPVATAALARAGSGDVLAGIVTGLRAQGLPAFEAAAVGAWIHAQAGLTAERVVGHSAAVLAGDIVKNIPSVLSMCW